MAVSRAYGDRKKKGEIKFNPATDRAYGGSNGFQAGSTFKVFVAAAALEDGLSRSATRSTRRTRRRSATSKCVRRHPHRPVGPGERVQQRERHLHAADRHRGLGQHLLRPARGAGRGLPAGARSPRDLGVTTADGKPLGTDQVVHPRHQPGVAADDGRGLRDVRRARQALQLDRDPRGRPTRPATGSRCRRPTASRCSTQNIADGMNELLQGVMTQRHRRRGPRLGRPAAGKTGTTDSRVPGLVRRLHPPPGDGGLGRQPAARPRAATR